MARTSICGDDGLSFDNRHAVCLVRRWRRRMTAAVKHCGHAAGSQSPLDAMRRRRSGGRRRLEARP